MVSESCAVGWSATRCNYDFARAKGEFAAFGPPQHRHGLMRIDGRVRATLHIPYRSALLAYRCTLGQGPTSGYVGVEIYVREPISFHVSTARRSPLAGAEFGPRPLDWPLVANSPRCRPFLRIPAPPSAYTGCLSVRAVTKTVDMQARVAAKHGHARR